jgi:hypothetical protein
MITSVIMKVASSAKRHAEQPANVEWNRGETEVSIQHELVDRCTDLLVAG